jgi:hypothetical protein
MICPIGTYPSPYQTCHHRRFQQWVRTGGVFEKILYTLSTDLRERGELDLSNVIDGISIVAKKRGWNEVGRATKGRGKGTKKLMAIISDNADLPIAIHIASTASPHHEVTALAVATVSTKYFVSNENPEHLVVGDKAYDR